MAQRRLDHMRQRRQAILDGEHDNLLTSSTGVNGAAEPQIDQLGYNLSALAQLIELIPSVLQRKEAELQTVEADVQAFSEKHGFTDPTTLPAEPEVEDADDDGEGDEGDDSESEAEEEFASEPTEVVT